MIPALVNAGLKVVAPDYRGDGHSSRTAGGYDKLTMAGDIHRLLRGHLELEGLIVMVGHDIGLMVAYAYAQAYRNELSHLVVADAPLPGTAVFDRLRGDPRVWHFTFHGARDIAEMLVAGRERQYFQVFSARCFDPSAIDDADLDVYVSAFSAPGAMRAGFELYRAFDRDAEGNRATLARNGKLAVPVLRTARLPGCLTRRPSWNHRRRRSGGRVTGSDSHDRDRRQPDLVRGPPLAAMVGGADYLSRG